MQSQQPFTTNLTATRVIWLLPILGLAHLAWYYPLLPNPLASHFGPSGKADGWMDKTAFAVFYLVLLVFLTGLFGALGALLHKTPSEFINLPNRDYWLTPERRESTLRSLSQQMSVFGIAIGAFFIAIMQTVFLSNLRHSGELGPLFVVYLLAFLGFTGVWVVQLTRQWRLPASS